MTNRARSKMIGSLAAITLVLPVLTVDAAASERGSGNLDVFEALYEAFDDREISHDGESTVTIPLPVIGLDGQLHLCVTTLNYAWSYQRPQFSLASDQDARVSFSVSNCSWEVASIRGQVWIEDVGLRGISNTHGTGIQDSGLINPPGPARANAFQKVSVYTAPFDYHFVGGEVIYYFRGIVDFKSGHIPAQQRICRVVQYRVGQNAQTEEFRC